MISIIICTYNPNKVFLERTINAIQNQIFKDFELIIVDNNSDFSVEKLPFILGNPNIKVCKELRQGLTAARWAGARIAKGEIIVYVDDDNLLDKEYLLVVDKTMRSNPKIGMMSGQILPEYEVLPPKWFKKYEGMLALREFKNNEGLVLLNKPTFNNYFPIGAGMVTRRSIIKEYYEKHLLNTNNYIEGRKGNELSSSEDLDFGFYNMSLGYSIGVNTRLNIIHIIPKSRIKMDYLIKLATSALTSSYYVNNKWKIKFKNDVLEIFKKSRIEIILRIIIYNLSIKPNAPLNKEYYIKLYQLIYKS